MAKAKFTYGYLRSPDSIARFCRRYLRGICVDPYYERLLVIRDARTRKIREVELFGRDHAKGLMVVIWDSHGKRHIE